MVQHEPCLQTNWASDQARYGKACYSDIPYLYTGRGFAEGLWPYADTDGRYQVMEYPVGISYLAWAAAEDHPAPPARVRRSPSGTTVDPALDVVAARDGQGGQHLLPGDRAPAVRASGCCATWFMAGVHPRRPWDALPFVLSPGLLMTGLINWDLMAVAFVAGALWAWARDRSVLTGVMIGLGAATKLYPLFLLGPILVDRLATTPARARSACGRGRGRRDLGWW